MIVPQPSLTRRTINAYETHQDLFLRQWNTRTYNIPPHLQSWIEHLPKRATLLDLGCGPGQDTRYLRRKGFHVYGVDLALPFLRAAKKRAPGLPLALANMQSLPFAFQVFDGIWAAASIIHVPKARARTLFRKLFALTKPSGWLAITVMYGREVGVLKHQWIPGRYLAKWYKQELMKAVQGAKWKVELIEKVNGQERKGTWLNLLARRPQ